METIREGARVLIVGSGAREHAIGCKLAQSKYRPVLFSAPGNPGLAACSECVNIAVDDVRGMLQFAIDKSVDLVVIGPELPLSLGLADACHRAGIRVFGPTQAAAQLETSKSFAKQVMARASVPTAGYEMFTDAGFAKRYVTEQGVPIVIKADGLAAGKGVVVAQTVQAAETAIDEMLVGRKFGVAGRSVVIEEFLEGKEASIMFFVAGEDVRAMVPARDHKRVGENDTGPNTGGMGAFAPVPDVSAELVAEVEQIIVRPVLAELSRTGITYQGVLYVGLMLTAQGPFVVEFNVRFGDPETEVVLPLLQSDLLEIMWAVADNRLSDTTVEWMDGGAVCVVLAAPGYPVNPVTGGPIQLAADSTGNTAPAVSARAAGGIPTGLTQNAADRIMGDGASDTPQIGARAGRGLLFHAGTKLHDNQLVTAGGRVMTAVGVAASLEQARSIAYETAETVYFDGKLVRRDIARDVSMYR